MSPAANNSDHSDGINRELRLHRDVSSEIQLGCSSTGDTLPGVFSSLIKHLF